MAEFLLELTTEAARVFLQNPATPAFAPIMAVLDHADARLVPEDKRPVPELFALRARHGTAPVENSSELVEALMLVDTGHVIESAFSRNYLATPESN